ncbi:hypothetical protein PUNSTDRAFT_139790 [Punctularia strigosozonata HHB-11173 SS5]|uniref:uncharacterized protein n=1 Tax=Punctularia strigosozonata (strain HHB-11173) TaxID=741275 RepID=UPI0004416F43|nr:uncharacterized protein PUNSTDRAFT_139790 [Punctularia strigosozonata HHB-11173 SS5]EIN13140.1 hypothetical protein PUNSTDRAFT_139790 [Punctularia strigosozonata HHB-11173 SS5]
MSAVTPANTALAAAEVVILEQRVGNLINNIRAVAIRPQRKISSLGYCLTQLLLHTHQWRYSYLTDPAPSPARGHRQHGTAHPDYVIKQRIFARTPGGAHRDRPVALFDLKRRESDADGGKLHREDYARYLADRTMVNGFLIVLILGEYTRVWIVDRPGASPRELPRCKTGDSQFLRYLVESARRNGLSANLIQRINLMCRNRLQR